MSNKYKIAICGAGHIAKKHIQAIKSIPEFELTAIIDPNKDAATALRDITNATYFNSISDMLHQHIPSLIAICTPSGMHAQQTIEAALAGIHIICEKPMALTLNDAKKMINVCESSNVHLFIVKQARYNAGIQAIHNKITTGQFGKIYMATANIFWTRPQEYFSASRWRGTITHDGGALLNQASHHIDLLTWLVGPITHCHAFADTLARQIETEDTLVANFKFDNHALGSLALTILTHPHNIEGSITLLGEKGSIKLGGKALSEMQVWKFSDPEQDELEMKHINQCIQATSGMEHLPYYRDILNCLENNSQPMIDGKQGYCSLKVMMAAYESIKIKQIVELSAFKEAYNA